MAWCVYIHFLYIKVTFGFYCNFFYMPPRKRYILAMLYINTTKIHNALSIHTKSFPYPYHPYLSLCADYGGGYVVRCLIYYIVVAGP